MELRQYTQRETEGKKVILRLDLDVPVNDKGQVDSWHDLRLERAAMTIKELIDFRAAKITLCGHRGRPEGKKDPQLSLMPVKDRLEILLLNMGVKEKIDFVEDLSKDSGSQLALLENLRFNIGEQENSSEFAKIISRWGDVYINDAFGVCHRQAASLVAITKVMPAFFAGPNLISEVNKLSSFMKGVGHPFAVILGGIKISTKLPLIKNLLNTADDVLLGGGLANTMFKAQGLETGRSVVELESLDKARALASEVMLPKDLIIRNKANNINVASSALVGKDDYILDIGPEAIKEFSQKIKQAKSILWNGPLGKFEDPAGREATEALAEAMVKSNANTLVGGGDTVVAVEQLKLTDKFGFVSVGGGAMLTFLAGNPLPGLEVLKK